jgi:5-methylcytosine-specific restriction endonuclease McrA
MVVTMTKQLSQRDLLLSYFQSKPNVPIPHAEVVDWVTARWLADTGTVFRDPDRGIRSLSQQGVLIKVRKGVYQYDPNYVVRKDLYDFSESQKQTILRAGGFKCVVCGMGTANGVDVQVDHIRPKDAGGLATLENGQVLCGSHNFMKKNYSQTEAGKRFFTKMREQAAAVGDPKMTDFCDEILATYAKYGYDSQI